MVINVENFRKVSTFSQKIVFRDVIGLYDFMVFPSWQSVRKIEILLIQPFATNIEIYCNLVN